MLNVTKKELKVCTQSLASFKNTVETGLNLSAENQDKIISAGGAIKEASCHLEDGFIHFTGKVYFNVVFTGEEMERLESGVKFDYKRAISGAPSSARANFTLSDIAIKEDGGMLYVVAELNADVVFTFTHTQKAVSGGNLLIKPFDVDTDESFYCRATFNGEENFEREKIKKVLSSNVDACITSVRARDDQVVVEGRVYANLVMLPPSPSADIVKERLSLPFSYEIECVGAKEGDNCFARCNVKGQTVKVLNLEESQNSQISVCFSLDIFACAMRCVSQTCACDAISCDFEVEKQTREITLDRFIGQRYCTERVFGKAICQVPEYARLVCAMQEYVVTTGVDFSGTELVISGIVFADCVFSGDNGIEQRRAEMPFEIKLDKNGQTVSDIKIVIESLNAKLKSGKIELDISLKVCFNESVTKTLSVIEELTQGEQKSTYKSVISVYMAKKGDTEWDVMRAMGETREVILANNPNISFPLSTEEKIMVFRNE